MSSEKMVITEDHLDYIKETFNIGVGKGAKILNTMLNSHIILSVPELSVLDKQNAMKELEDKHENLLASVDLNFKGPLSGMCKLIFPTESALQLVNEVQGNEMDDIEEGFDAMSEGVLKEVGNIVLNSVIGILCNYLKIQLNYSVPTFTEGSINDLVDSAFSENDTVALLARIQFHIESMNVKGDVMTIFNMGSFSQLLKLIDEQLNEV